MKEKNFSPKPSLYKKAKKPARTHDNYKSYDKTETYSGLVSHALRRMNYYVYKVKEETPDEVLVQEIVLEYPAILAEVLMQDVGQVRSQMMGAYEAGMNGGFSSRTRVYSWEYAEQQAENAVRSARELWDPTVFPAIQERAAISGRRGGLKGKVGLEDYIATAHMSDAERAEALGVERTTAWRLRKKYENLNLENGEINAEEQQETSQPERSQPVEVWYEPGGGVSAAGDRMEEPYAGRSTGPYSKSPVTSGVREVGLAYTGTLPF